jgi:hypothetical protein
MNDDFFEKARQQIREEMKNYVYDPEKKQTRGKGLESLEAFLNSKEKMKGTFKPKEKHWAPVLKQQDIQLQHNAGVEGDKIFISCFVHGKFEVAEVPKHFIAEYPANDTVFVYSHAMQRIVESFIPFTEYIINRCINEAVIFHPCDELKFSIDINT